MYIEGKVIKIQSSVEDFYGNGFLLFSFSQILDRTFFFFDLSFSRHFSDKLCDI